MPARGGLRPNAGRKPKEITQLRKNFAALILSDASEATRWKKMLDSDNERVALDALKAISEFKHGKAKQSLEVDGTLELVTEIIVNV